ncbi:hypothetical protein FKM82_017027 [Ascaphus truei]
MADAPPGPSVLSPPELSQFPGAGMALTAGYHPGEEEEEEEEEGRYGQQGNEASEGPKSHHRHHHHLNGLISPGLRHLKAVSLRTRPEGPGRKDPRGLPASSPPHHERTAAPNGLDRVREIGPLTAGLAACTLRGGDPGTEGDIAIRYVRYQSEFQMPDIMRLITRDLSEPYSIYTYRYFIHNWPQLCFLAVVGEECVGAIVCKLDMHKKMFRRGYIAMLAVDSKYRRKGIGTNLVKKAIYAMVEGDCDEVVLETEITNKSALKLYENLGFVRDKRLFRYYLNGVDALRLKLWLR